MDVSRFLSGWMKRAVLSKTAAKVVSPNPITLSGATEANHSPLIDLRQVIKIYNTPAGSLAALKNVDLQVEAGEFVAVVGKSGSGKSTLINMITGIDRPTLGEVIIGGMPIHTLNEDQVAHWRGQRIGIIFQFFQLLPTLTLLENVMMPMELAHNYTRSERIERGMTLLSAVDMTAEANKFPKAVSGGQQQRTAIARALANEPDVLIADEPTGSLDSKTADSIFQLFENFVSQGRTILMVTHDRDLASRVSRVVHIADGQITDQYISKALQKLSTQQLVQVSTKLEPVTVEAGATVFQQGDPADKFYIIVQGQVEVVIAHANGPTFVAAVLGSGQYFGEMGLLEGGQRTATVRATAEATVTLMSLDRDIFRQLMSNSETTYETIAMLMRQRTTTSNLLAALPELITSAEGQLQSSIEYLTYQPGQIIFREGEAADKLYFITQGEVEVVHQTGTAEQVLAQLGSGQYFGEMQLIGYQTRTATVRAALDSSTDLAVMAIDHTTFRELRETVLASPTAMTDLARQRVLELNQAVEPELNDD